MTSMRALLMAMMMTLGACVPELPIAVPAHFPALPYPDDNVPTAEKMALGESLFFDVRLSANETQSCGSCHDKARAFTDGKALPVGSTGDVVPRNAMPLMNVAWASTLTWANPLLLTLEEQALVPLFADHPDAIELGISAVTSDVLARFEPERPQFEAAFPDESDAVSIATITKAIASYERGLIAADSRYDRYVYGGEPDALTDVEKRGLQLFNSERAECYHCHGGVFFTSAVTVLGSTATESGFENNGLYDVEADDADPRHLGLFAISGEPRDRGRFKVPTLRNIAVTGPYMHDGSLATLEDVMAHYRRGGTHSIRQNPLIRPLDLSDDEEAALLAFLRALTDVALE